MLFTCAFFFYAAAAQKVSLVADRGKVLIGEQVNLLVKVEDVDPAKSFLTAWFTLDDSAIHIQVVKKEPLDTLAINGLHTYLQKITITSFDSGRWPVTPPPVAMQDKITGRKILLTPDSLYIEVLPVDVSGMLEYHELKDILAVETTPNYLLYGGIIAALAVLILAAWFFIRRFSKKPPAAKPVYKNTALDEALQQLKVLQQQGATTNEEIKVFYTRLAAICRNYFNTQLSANVQQATTDELMVMLIVYLQDVQKRSAFYQVLRLTDAVKFARFLPGNAEHEQAIKIAVASLQHIDQMIKQSQPHDN